VADEDLSATPLAGTAVDEQPDFAVSGHGSVAGGQTSRHDR
jgi:hypothetical protein